MSFTIYRHHGQKRSILPDAHDIFKCSGADGCALLGFDEGHHGQHGLYQSDTGYGLYPARRKNPSGPSEKEKRNTAKMAEL